VIETFLVLHLGNIVIFALGDENEFLIAKPCVEEHAAFHNLANMVT